MVVVSRHTDTHRVFHFERVSGYIGLGNWPLGGAIAGAKPEESIPSEEESSGFSNSFHT